MELGWFFGEKNRQPLDNQHYVQDAPRTYIQGTEEDQGRDEGRTWMVSKNCHHVAQKWSSREENHF